MSPSKFIDKKTNKDKINWIKWNYQTISFINQKYSFENINIISFHSSKTISLNDLNWMKWNYQWNNETKMNEINTKRWNYHYDIIYSLRNTHRKHLLNIFLTISLKHIFYQSAEFAIRQLKKTNSKTITLNQKQYSKVNLCSNFDEFVMLFCEYNFCFCPSSLFHWMEQNKKNYRKNAFKIKILFFHKKEKKISKLLKTFQVILNLEIQTQNCKNFNNFQIISIIFK